MSAPAIRQPTRVVAKLETSTNALRVSTGARHVDPGPHDELPVRPPLGRTPIRRIQTRRCPMFRSPAPQSSQIDPSSPPQNQLLAEGAVDIAPQPGKKCDVSVSLRNV
ncbi:unnamed protein product [Clavelina lepadiformis]|uniref:Uncharacterized protein n=1 Tax=Clavelina lepadiformis TaxID=159417 RepID=A0ABP0GZR4_CLALP